jgi:hypothetical protein
MRRDRATIGSTQLGLVLVFLQLLLTLQHILHRQPSDHHLREESTVMFVESSIAAFTVIVGGRRCIIKIN